jgi:hypothetical protein
MQSMRRNTAMWNFTNNTIKDFRSCCAFLDHLVDAHTLAAIAATVGVTTWEALQDNLTEKNWRKTIIEMEKRFGDDGLIDERRRQDEASRDFVFENAVLLLQHGLMFKRFSAALKTGDVGWVVHCIKYFTIWLCNDGIALKNYRSASLHLMASLTHIWSPELKSFWMDSCLLNISGSPTGFMPCDLLNEYVVREMKARRPANVNPVNDNFHRNVYGPQIMISKAVRDNMYKAVGAVQHYQHSSIVSSQTDVETVTRLLLRERVFHQLPARKMYNVHNDIPIQQSIDLFGRGLVAIIQGKHIDALKQSFSKNRPWARVEAEEMERILDPEHEDYDGEEF